MSLIRHIQRQLHVISDEAMLVACSGGVDSVVLVDLCHRLRYDFAIVHVDHMLRGEQSYEDLQFVRELAERYGRPFYSKRINIPAIVEKTKENVQQCCRDERYHFFHEVMREEGYAHLITAHHADDAIETALMQWMRGQPPTGIADRRPFYHYTLHRPLLRRPKEELWQYANRHQLRVREDPSNADDDYVRNAIRHRIIPQFESLPSYEPSSILDGLLQNREDQMYLETLAKQRISEIVVERTSTRQMIDVETFQNEAVALQRRIILLLLKYLYRSVERTITYSKRLIDTLQKELNCTTGHTTIHLPAGGQFRREYTRAYFEWRVRETTAHPRDLRIDEPVPWGSFIFCLRHCGTIDEMREDTTYYAVPTDRIRIRSRREGDRLHWKGMTSPKKIARLFIDEKISKSKRDHWPLIVDAVTDEVLIIPNVRWRRDVHQNTMHDSHYVVTVQHI